jgi:hypothetical protein
MRKIQIPLRAAITIFPEMYDLGNMPRKKKKKMKKEFSNVFTEKFKEWLENGKGEI